MPMISFQIHGLDTLLADFKSSTRDLRDFRVPLNNVMEAYEDFAWKKFETQGASAGAPWAPLQPFTLKMRATRAGYYRRPGSPGKIGVWSTEMQSSLTRGRGTGSIRTVGATRMKYGSQFLKAVVFHFGRWRGRTHQKPRHVIPLPQWAIGNMSIDLPGVGFGTQAGAIAFGIFSRWMKRRVPVFMQSTGSIITP